MKYPTSVGLIVLAFNSQPAAAQANPDSVKFRNGRRLYARIIGTGNPSPQAQEASIHILACPEAGAALALQLSSLSQSSDTTQLEAYLGHIQGLRDAALYQAATTLAQDHAATALARITALEVLLRQPGFLWTGGRRCLRSSQNAANCGDPGGTTADELR